MRKLMPLALVAALTLFGCKSSVTAPNTQQTLPLTDSLGNVALPVPSPDSGIQLVYGPFKVPTGQEVQIDHYFKLPTDLPFEVGRIQIATNDGTHHMNLFRTLNVHPDTDEYNFASQAIWDESDLMIESQSHYIDWKLPAGVSVKLNQHEQMCMQVHYVNAQTQNTPNGYGKIVVNIYKSTTTNNQHASMLFAQKKSVLIRPHSDTTFSKFCSFGIATKPLNIYAMTGHFHSRGRSFVVEKWDSVSQTSLGVIYQNATWSEPPFKVFDPPIVIQPGQLIRYTATYHNDSDSTIVFGPKVDLNEHCNLFLWFSPGYKDGQTIYDFTQ